MKKIATVFICLVILLLPLSITSASATDSSAKILSNMSYDECIGFLESNNIDVPAFFLSDDNASWFPEYVLDIIAVIEENPAAVQTTGYAVTPTFWSDIQEAVNTHYNRELSDYKHLQSSRYTLQYSTVRSPWQASFANQNCYGYALGYPNVFTNPGAFSNNNNYTPVNMPSVSTLAQYVKADLKSSAFSMSCVKITTTRPTAASMVSGQAAICIRRGNKMTNSSLLDFHFMKLSLGNWNHKPGGTQPLQYNSLPSNSVNWNNEHVIYDVAHEPTYVYTGSVMYILFKFSHGTPVNVYTGENYHDGSTHYYQYALTCPHCGDVIGAYTWQAVPCTSCNSSES